MRIVKNYTSQAGDTFQIKFEKTINYIIKDIVNLNYSIVKFDILIDSNDNSDFTEASTLISDIIKEIFNNKIPAYNIIHQKSNSNSDILIQCHLFNNTKVNIQYKKILNHPYVVVDLDNEKQIYSGGISFINDSFLLSVQRCFDFAEQILMKENMGYKNVFRQWNYIPDINSSTSFNGEESSNLEIFNQIKSFFYEDQVSKKSHSLFTNISSNNGSLSIDFIASNLSPKFIPNSDFSLENKVIISDNEVWISFSPSILDDIISPDIEQETIQSLNSIFSLNKIFQIQEDSFKDSIKFLKIYTPNEDDFKQIEELVKEALPNTEILLVESGIDNEDNFMHIEGILSLT